MPPSTDQPPDDLALMRRIAAGDTMALKHFYDRHSSAVYTLCLRMLRQAQDAEALLTDVFFEIWNSRGRYDETRASPATYLMRLTRSRAIDVLRRKGPTGIAGSMRLGADDFDPPAAPESAGAALESQDDRARIEKALALLDADHRRIIECAYFDGLTQSQIARQLSKPLGTIKSSMRLGLARLRDLLRPEESP